jgi:transcriptional regulator with GAF, ATPase, and Fis domain
MNSSLELVVVVGEGTEIFPLPPSGRVSLGRSEKNDIRIDHPSVSRRHAVLHLGPPLQIEDLGGTNGTFVRERRPAEKTGETQGMRQLSGQAAEIAPGDTITLSAVTIVVRRVSGQKPGISADAPGSSVVVASPATRALWAEAQLAAKSSISVLLLGETGVGKEVLARAVHDASLRGQKQKPFLGLNCAALSESLLESELFGHEKGAFTGAVQARPGLFEAADGGTVFLDEVGELPASTQVKLLRVIELREVMRVGGRSPRHVDVRFIAATNRDLEAESARGAFRQDLFFRLNGIALTIPPLRERVPEIAALARVFLNAACAKLDRPMAAVLTPEALTALERYAWPGNVRELRNVIDRAVVLSMSDQDKYAAIRPEHLPPKVRDAAAKGAPPAGAKEAPPAPVKEVSPAAERDRIIAALEACAWNQTQAAAKLGMSRRTLIYRIEEYGLPRPRKKG